MPIPTSLFNFHAQEEESAPDIDTKAASALALGLAQRLGFLSKQSGASHDASRLSAGAAAIVCQGVLQGHVCMPLHICASKLGIATGTLREALLQSKVVCDERSLTAAPRALLPLVLDAGNRLYLARYYDYERRLAEQLSGLIQTPLPVLDDRAASLQNKNDDAWGACIRRYSDILGLADHQRLAVALTVLNRLTLISGGPGTGKTTTTTALLACLLERDPTLRIALAAPTGRAAQHLFHALTLQASRLSEELVARLPQKAFTVHRLLSERALAPHVASSSTASSKQSAYTASHASLLPYDLIIIDEASMLDIVLATQLLEALPSTARLVWLGDKHQLSAVEAGAVFASLTAHSYFTPEYVDRLARVLPENLELLSTLRPHPLELNHSEKKPSTVQAQLHFNFDNTPEADDAISSKELEPHTPSESAAPALANCSVELERNYRFAKDSYIGRLALAIRDVDACAALALLSPVAMHAPSLQEKIGEEGSDDSVVLIEEHAPSNSAPSKEYGGAPLSTKALEHLAKGLDTYFEALSTLLFNFENTQATHAATHSSFEILNTALNTYRVLCPVYEGPRGVGALNAGLDQFFRAKLLDALDQYKTRHFNLLSLTSRTYLMHMRASLGQVASVYKDEGGGGAQQNFPLYAGLPLMVTRNDYSLDLFNGDIGIVLPRYRVPKALAFAEYAQTEGEDSALYVLFYKPDKSLRIVLPSLLPPWRAAFAMTVHKAQGSEFNHVALVLPSLADHSNRFPLTRAMLYTAITRARQKVTLLGSAQALESAIHTSTPLYSGLQARLGQSS